MFRFKWIADGKSRYLRSEELYLATAAEILLSVPTIVSWQNASRAYLPVGEEPICVSSAKASYKWTVECFQLTHSEHTCLYC